MRILNSIKNIYTGIFSQAVTVVLQFVYRTVFIHLLGETYLGVNGLFTNILTIFSFAELGIGQAIIFSLYKPIAEENIPKISALMDLYRKTYQVIGVVILAAGACFTPFLPYIIKGSTEGIEHLNWIYLLFVVNSGSSYFFAYRTSFLTASQRQYVLNRVNYKFAVLTECAKTAVLALTRSFVLVLVTQTLLLIVQNAYNSAKTVQLYPFLKNTRGASLEKEDREKIFKDVKALIIYKVGTLALNSTDNIIISAEVGLAAVGLYSNYAVIVSSVSVFLSIIFSSLTASIGNLNAQEDDGKKELMFHVISFVTFWVYSASSICFFIALNPFIDCWIGERYLLDTWTVLVIALNVYVGGMLYAPFNYRQTMGLFVYGKWRPIASAVVNIVVSIFLGRRIGLVGVLAGTIIARVTTNGWFDPYIVYKKGLRKSPAPYLAKLCLYGVLLFAMGGLCTAACALLPAEGILGILFHCVLVMVLCSGVYTVLFWRTREFRYLWEVFLGLIRTRGRKNE